MTTFCREESISSSQSKSESLAEISVGHNRILDALLAEQLLFDAQRAFEDNKWQTAWQLSKEMLALRLKNFLWKNNAN